MTDYEARRAQIRKEARRRRWRNRIVNTIGVSFGASGIIALIVGLAVLVAFVGGLSVYIGWNLGVHGIAQAVHTSVGHISYWTAVGTGIALGALGTFVRGPATVQLTKKQ